MNKLTIKTPEELKIMQECGKILSDIKKTLVNHIKIGVSAFDIDKLAENLIEKAGAKPSFKMVKDYKWSTCISVNEGVVHGIPHKHIIFKRGDLVSLDLGIFYKGFHTDTSTTLCLGKDAIKDRFLNIGREAFSHAVYSIKPNNSYIYDISNAMESVLIKNGYSPIKDLTGHGIGKNLHEDPYIPCFASGRREDTAKIITGMALAIEVMYVEGNSKLMVENDGWTIKTRDGKMAGLFEDTVIVTQKGYKVIT